MEVERFIANKVYDFRPSPSGGVLPAMQNLAIPALNSHPTAPSFLSRLMTLLRRTLLRRGHHFEENLLQFPFAMEGTQIRQGAQGDQLSALDNADAVSQFLRDIQKVGGHENGDAGPAAGF